MCLVNIDTTVTTYAKTIGSFSSRMEPENPKDNMSVLMYFP